MANITVVVLEAKQENKEKTRLSGIGKVYIKILSEKCYPISRNEEILKICFGVKWNQHQKNIINTENKIILHLKKF